MGQLPKRAVCVLAAASAALAGCHQDSGSRASENGSLRDAVRGSRPIGRGPRFHPRLKDVPVPDCRPKLGNRYGVHLEIFARNRVVLVPAGVGTRPPRTVLSGRIQRARCYGSLVTLDPTGLVLVRRAGATPALGDFFDAWHMPLTAKRAYVNGVRRRGSPRTIRLAPHAEIVLESGPYVPPHRGYRFPPGL